MFVTLQYDDDMRWRKQKFTFRVNQNSTLFSLQADKEHESNLLLYFYCANRPIIVIFFLLGWWVAAGQLPLQEAGPDQRIPVNTGIFQVNFLL